MFSYWYQTHKDSIDMKKYFLIFLILPSFHFSVFSQANEGMKLNIKKAEQAIKVDGILDEPDWKTAEVQGDFRLNFPVDTAQAEAQSEVMVTYDKEFLYVGAILHGQTPDEYVVTSLKRDFDFFQNDQFAIFIDPFLDRTNGFNFAISPEGVQREGLIFNGRRTNTDWDNRWFSKVTKQADKWVVEIAIPFKTLRYKSDNPVWNINFARINVHDNQWSTWAPVPQQFFPTSLNFAGTLAWDTAPPAPKANIAVIPYLSGGYTKDSENNTPSDVTGDVGFDAKIGISSGLTLDLTVNPDFSQVEVDQQVTNLDRFELFFPERRQFFLENQDLFAEFGSNRIRPFFSRRIGLNSPIIAGARLSGKVNNSLRVGVLNIQTKETTDEEEAINGQNFTIAAVQKQVFGQSNISFIFVNRQQFDVFRTQERSAFTGNNDDFNRVVGLDYNLRTRNNKLSGKIFYHQSISTENNTDNFAHGVQLRYNTRNLFVAWNHDIIGDNYNAETGFVPRTGTFRVQPFARYRFYPKKGKINRHGPGIRFEQLYSNGNDLTDRSIRGFYDFNFKNSSRLEFGASRQFVKLTSSFDPTNSDGRELAENSEHAWSSYNIGFTSDRRKLFNFQTNLSYGGFFNGERLNVNGNINYRIQPIASIGIRASFNQIDLPEGFNDRNFFLIGPRLDLTLTDKIFITTFVQYNDQIDNVNLNTRFQWRFKPVSDLFIVYTENYLPQNFASKNRALILKFTYWLNV